ncbi:MAG: hypothetical protein ABI855_08795 [Bacteroidota bacterium]
MKIIVKPSFSRDVDKVNDKELKTLLDLKITQIEKAKSTDNITGLKLLRTYTTHYRIKIEKKNINSELEPLLEKILFG